MDAPGWQSEQEFEKSGETGEAGAAMGEGREQEGLLECNGDGGSSVHSMSTNVKNWV